MGSLWARLRRKAKAKPKPESGIILYDMAAPLKYMYPKPVDAAEILHLSAIAEKHARGFVPAMRLINFKTGDEITGPIHDEANAVLEVTLP